MQSLDIEQLDQSCRDIEQRLADFKSVQPEHDNQLPVLGDPGMQLELSDGIPVVELAGLTAETLAVAMRRHGLLLVRGVADQDFCQRYRQAIDHVMDDPRSTAKNPVPEEQVRSFYRNPPQNLLDFMSRGELAETRAFHRVSNSTLCVESTGLAGDLMAFYQGLGLPEILQAYLGESPCLSLHKWVLRRVPEAVREDGWHQDGSFMGTDIRSINMWLPLTDCGGDSAAPGMDIVPVPIDRIYKSENGLYDWSLTTEDVMEWFRDSPPQAPRLAAGDALFFDHYSLHRTQYRESFSQPRYAIETWFFGARNFPANQVPLRW